MIVDETAAYILKLERRIKKLEEQAKEHEKQIRNLLGEPEEVIEQKQKSKEPMKNFVLMERYVEEKGCDRWGSWGEEYFVPYQSKDGHAFSFNTLEEAQEYVYGHADEFEKKVYCENITSKKRIKLRKVRK